jgi:hypothetical protein
VVSQTGVHVETDTQPPRRGLFDALSDQPDASAFDGPVDPETIGRSDMNILKWQEYLPEDCIRCMIQMKWDVTT